MSATVISWISLQTTGIVFVFAFAFVVGISDDELRFELELLRFEMSQREMRKRRMTKAAPTAIPITTHKRIPKMEVGLESWSSMNPGL